MAAYEKLDVYINQNVVILTVGFVGLGFSEFHGLENGVLHGLSMVLSVAALISVCASLIAYTKNYWRKKSKKNVLGTIL